MLLCGKTVIVTGSRKGIGRAIVEACAEQGADVFACARRYDEKFVSEMTTLANRCGVSVRPLFFDMTDAAGVKKAVAEMKAASTHIDVLVNNAGMVADGAVFHMTSIDTFREVFEVNFFSQMRLTQYISRIMCKQEKGSIINITSIAGIDGNPGQVEYSASKAALGLSTRRLASELGPCGIRVNAVAPGVIGSDMGEKVADDLLERVLASSVMGRVGMPEEIARAVVFFASDWSSYITGQILRVDGGTLLND